MTQLMSRRRRLRHVALLSALAAASAVMFVGSAASSAWANSSFNCESRGQGKTCLNLSGPNETMEEGEGDNYTRARFELSFFKYNGGSNYTEIYSKIFNSYTATHCYSSVFKGHLTVAAELEYSNLAGTQKEGCIA